MPFLEVRDISKRFGNVLAVDNVSFNIEKGAFLTLLGPSGCGKTTTLRLIAGFLEPDTGEIYINGELQNDKPPYKRNIGIVFQNYALFPHMTVEENIAFGLKMRKIPTSIIKQRVTEMLELVKLSGFEKRYPRELSGGQQQRVALARALVIEPDVLLLDEPLSNLDLKLRLQMRYEIKRLQKIAGITTVYVTHDQGEALAMSDLIAVMNQGRLLQIGTPWEIYNNPSEEFVAEFIGETNILNATLVPVDPEGLRVEFNGGQNIVITFIKPELLESRKKRKVKIGIRPEHITIMPFTEPPKDLNLLRGQIIDKIYAGTYFEYMVKLDDDVVLKIKDEEIHKNLSVGDLCYIKFDYSKMQIIEVKGNKC